MLHAFAKTDTGKTRSLNQDAIFACTEPVGALPNLFIIADGMGGHNGGEIASKTAISAFVNFINTNNTVSAENILDLLTSAAKHANHAVLQEAEQNPDLSGMGTTLTACAIINDGLSDKYNLVHIGDSRAYTINQDAITQLTTDHTFVSEMIKAGQMSQSEARDHPKRSALTRVLGIALDMNFDGYIQKIEPGTNILLCSDGLYNMISENEIKELSNNSENPAEDLVSAANANGGTDNISVILIKID